MKSTVLCTKLPFSSGIGFFVSFLFFGNYFLWLLYIAWENSHQKLTKEMYITSIGKCKNVATQMQKCGHSRQVTLQYSGLVRQTTL